MFVAKFIAAKIINIFFCGKKELEPAVIDFSML